MVLPMVYVPFVTTAVGSAAVLHGLLDSACFGWRAGPFYGSLGVAALGWCLLHAAPITPSTVAPDAEMYDEAVRDAFERADADGDGRLDTTEFNTFEADVSRLAPPPRFAAPPLQPGVDLVAQSEALRRQIEDQRSQIAQLQQTIRKAPVANTHVFPPPVSDPLPPIGGGSATTAAEASSAHQGGWAVPPGAQPGQIFLVGGAYYVAVPRLQSDGTSGMEPYLMPAAVPAPSRRFA